MVSGQNNTQHRKTASVMPLVALSVLLHVGVFWLLNHHVEMPVSEPKPAPLPPLKARLVTLPPPLPPPEAAPTQPEIPDNPPSQPLLQQRTETTVVGEPPPSQAAPPETSTVEIESGPITESQPSAPAQRLSSAEMARRHLQQFQHQRTQQMIQQQAVEHRRNHISPSFPAANVDPFETEDEAFVRKNAIRANCDKGANAVIGSVLNILGGSVRCTDPPPINEYIERRVNKQPAPAKR